MLYFKNVTVIPSSYKAFAKNASVLNIFGVYEAIEKVPNIRTTLLLCEIDKIRQYQTAVREAVIHGGSL